MKKLSIVLSSLVVGAAALMASASTEAEVSTAEPTVSAEPVIGELMMFAGNFAPRGWALCDGQLLSIAQNTALFSLLGTTYGGDGRTTFGLPDLRGRVPVHPGRGPGLTPRQLGEKGGQETVTLTTVQMPNHNHAVQEGAGQGEGSEPGGGPVSTPVNGAGEMSGSTGGSQPHPNMQPFQCINYCIALNGVYPSRS